MLSWTIIKDVSDIVKKKLKAKKTSPYEFYPSSICEEDKTMTENISLALIQLNKRKGKGCGFSSAIF